MRLKILGRKYTKPCFGNSDKSNDFFFSSNIILVLINDNQVIKNVEYITVILASVTLGMLPLFMRRNVKAGTVLLA